MPVVVPPRVNPEGSRAMNTSPATTAPAVEREWREANRGYGDGRPRARAYDVACAAGLSTCRHQVRKPVAAIVAAAQSAS